MDRRICLYFRPLPEQDRWLPGDRFVRPAIRRLIRGRPRVGGVEKVFRNLCLGLDRLGIEYVVNEPFRALREQDWVAVLGQGRHSLDGYAQKNRIVAGIGLMSHPGEWPTLCDDYPVVRYLQHSQWTCDIYRPYFGDRCGIWPVGIDTAAWTPGALGKDIDFLVYDKVHWNRDEQQSRLIEPVKDTLTRHKLKWTTIRYGTYTERQYRELLARSRAMVFLSETESQGIAYQECLACDVPVLAWDQGFWLDPTRFKYGADVVPATSVPYFDARCGRKFKGADDFEPSLQAFLDQLSKNAFKPREYVLENLTVEQSAQRFVDILAKDLS